MYQTPTTDARARRSGARATLAGLLVVGAVALTGCLPGTPLESWVPDLNGDGTIDQSETNAESARLAAVFAQAIERHRREVQRHPFLTCVRRHESDRSGVYPHISGYRAQNPSSSASGAYQFIDSTWRGAAARAGHPGYSKAKYAPWYVQDAVALHVVKTGGKSAWNGTGC
jgi:muramidase (phage lysozyme)